LPARVQGYTVLQSCYLSELQASRNPATNNSRYFFASRNPEASQSELFFLSREAAARVPQHFIP